MVLDVLLPGWSQATEPQYLTAMGIMHLSQQAADSGVQLDRVTAREIHLTADGGGGWLAVPLLSYHGWTAATESGQKVATRTAPNGLLEVEAPSGFARIHLLLPVDWMERAALALSIGCSLLTLILLAGSFGRARTARAYTPEAARPILS
jgi:hypothetical protein